MAGAAQGWSGAALGLLAAMLLAAPAALAQQKPIRIGMTLTLSGDETSIAAGTMLNRGYQLWQDEVNGRGGVLGRPVELVVWDDGGDRESVSRIYERMIARGEAEMLLGPSDPALVSVAAAAAAKGSRSLLVPGLAPDALWPSQAGVVFGMVTPAARQALGMLEMLIWYGLDRVAILAAEDSLSADLAAGAARWARRLGLKLVVEVTVRRDEESYNKAVAASRSAAVDAVLMMGGWDEAKGLRRALHRAGWSPSAYFASVGPAGDRYGIELGALAEQTFSVTPWEPSSSLAYSGATSFIDSFRQAFEIEPDHVAATAYATGQLVEQALERARSTDPERLREALQTLSGFSVIGGYGVDRTGQQLRQIPLVVQWLEGRRHIVWPQQLGRIVPVFQ